MTADVARGSHARFVRRESLLMTGVMRTRCAAFMLALGTDALTCRRDNRRTGHHERYRDGNQSGHHQREYTWDRHSIRI
jgi:hypothetical protein